MSTEQTTDTPASLDAFLKDPLSIPEGADLEALAAGDTSQTTTQPEQHTEGAQEATQTTADEQGEKHGDAPGTGTAATGQDKGTDATTATEGDGTKDASKPEGEQQQEQPTGVASKDGKHVIPYEELRSTRERAARAEIMVQELTGKLEALTNEISTGQASKTRDVADIVDEEVLATLREESPEVAQVIDKLIERNQALAEQAQSAHAATADTERESRVQAVVAVEDAINAVEKLAYVRANDPTTFTVIAGLDTMLSKQAAWKDKPLADRFDAAVRMYEVANGEIDLPETHAASRKLPADTDARVKAALAKADAAAGGPSTLSDIPGGELAAESSQDEMAKLSSAALTERFMNMSPDQIEAELARFS